MASIFHTIYESKDSTYSTRNFYAEYPSLEDIQIEPCQFKPTKLSESLATISNLCYDGFKDIDDMPQKLTKLRNTIMELMIYCIRIERSAYHEYIQALARKTNLFMERIVLKVLQACQDSESPASCFHLVKAIHDVVLLMYSFTNPLKIPDLLSGISSVSTEALVSAFKVEDIFEATKELHAFILCYPLLHDVDMEKPVPCSSSDNNTPKKLFKGEAAEILDYLAKINLVVINNTVPTASLFRYFESMLASDKFSLLELEYFEEFLSHFARVSKFCQLQQNTALFDRQKEELHSPFFQMIQLNPFNKLDWCTPLQAVNYLQIFVDLYNEIYNERLILERWYNNETGHEATVVRRIVDEQVAQACDCPQDHPSPATPEFVNFFSQSVIQQSESTPDTVAVESSVDYNGKLVHLRPPGGQLCGRLPNIQSPLPKSHKIFQLNEQVAYELRDFRSLIEERYRVNKVSFKEHKCLKCKYLPWHKHVYG
ncbi:hypothetical protein METBIDRAFT_64822 [Metschnikowia bicuspidata var. bicuspidata NRRL YB-4993]|uniref:Uncharacterized protein n=1 Tax=Metschnikowia bicuspidata var. bicuspidata NRRL YB-4993 TaxID=869754 RepID=A0A1A0HI78_9ASCO|nr:hypothetical protein METBIDRAFT_64822 [Metschnikowia bicuspidata var. bicuspidata NRRL YB-4993]OBA23710.1 hypothetical protein METBIDRAFT_64822 [Metschnikowia bicuspidata var. bicuspidata NRRL YB-4993]